MKRRVLSLFSGCGGMDLGFEGGFKTLKNSVDKTNLQIATPVDSNWVILPPLNYSIVFANDIKASAKATWTKYFSKKGNKPETYILDSIVDLVKRAESGNFNFPSEIDIVTGGFPCQDFSVAGKRLGLKSNKSHLGSLLTEDEIASTENRGSLYIWMKEVIEITRPKMFIAENVKGLANLEGVKSIIQRDFESIGNMGYLVVEPRILHAGQYGVPQKRERIIFMGFRKDALKSQARKLLSQSEIPADYDPYPKPSHSIEKKPQMTLSPFVSVKEALFDLCEPELEKIDDSQKSYSKAKRLNPGLQGQSEVNLDDLSPTIRSEHHGNIEYRRLSIANGGKHLNELLNGMQERRLTVRECARLQTFPDDYDFVFSSKEGTVSASEAYKLVGNAVPPLLAFRIAQRLEEIWDCLFKED